MLRPICLILFTACLVCSETYGQAVANTNENESVEIVDALGDWLKLPGDERPDFYDLPFIWKPLSKTQATKITAMLWQDFQSQMKKTRTEEWAAKNIKIGDLSMKFDYRVFGEKPNDGRSLFISMHGGGGAAARVNDQQWRNQIGLYQPNEGIYLAPRAPTDAWNMWHQAHIDQFFYRIIQDAVLFADVNPDKVYLMGYSAGGDGVYQLAPRMADSLAAAAMMAGHPNEALPLGLRNIGFTLHMGAKDRAYNRNKIAAEWKIRLAELQEKDPGGYQHKVVIHKDMGHWMKRKDAAAIDWMQNFTRDALPKKIVWKQDDVTHRQFYWLSVAKGKEKQGALVVAQHDRNSVEILNSENVEAVQINLNDEMADLDQPIGIKVNGKAFTRMVTRKTATIYETIQRRGDRKLIFSSQFNVPIKN